jgi:hypothetical protein
MMLTTAGSETCPHRGPAPGPDSYHLYQHVPGKVYSAVALHYPSPQTPFTNAMLPVSVSTAFWVTKVFLVKSALVWIRL